MQSLQSRLDEALSLKNEGNYEGAHASLTGLISEAQTATDPFLATLLNHRGILNREWQKYVDALNDYRSALMASDSDEQKAFTHINIADLHRNALAGYPAAHSSLDEALTFCENGSFNHALAVDQRGLVFKAQKDYHSAIESYKRAMRVCEDILQKTPSKNVENRVAQICQHLGDAYLELKDPALLDEAVDYQNRAAGIFREHNDKRGTTNTLTILGRIAMAKKQYDVAIKEFEEAYRIANEMNDNRGITLLSLDLTEAYLHNDNIRNANLHASRFTSGVSNQEISGHDINQIRDQYHRVVDLGGTQVIVGQHLKETAAVFK
ncbi:MAG: hypothetical protein ABIH34_00765 [Nanoarchaeota archaeon]